MYLNKMNMASTECSAD